MANTSRRSVLLADALGCEPADLLRR